MNEAEKKQLAGLFAMYAAYYRVKLEDEVLRMYADDLGDLPYSAVRASLEVYRRNPKNRSMPMPSMIRETLCPAVDPDSTAREIAARISGAVAKFGWNNSDRAREFIGEIGWGIVERRGGWMHICQNLGVSVDPTAFEAQVREQAKAEVKYGHTAVNDTLGLAPGARYGELQSIGEIMSTPKLIKHENNGGDS